MPFQRRRRALVFSEDEQAMLERLRKSRTEQKRRTVRAASFLDSVAGLSDQAIARLQRVNRNTVILCIQKCLRFGVQAALGELPRSGKPRRVSHAAMAWVQNCACQKPKELGYAQELWTYRLLTAYLRQNAGPAGYPELERVSRSKLHTILMQGELRPHKVRYYVERRDPEFESKMAAVLHVYKEVEILNEGLLRGEIREPGMVTVSYDEKPGIQALAQKTPDRPPMPGQHASLTRDYEYKRGGTVSLLAGLDLHRGTVTEIVSQTHKSKDFIELLKKLGSAYLASRPQRFQFVFVPKHGSWLNLVENMFSKMARSMLREIRVHSKQELIQRIHLYFEEVNAAPVVFRWKYKMDEVSIDYIFRELLSSSVAG